MKTKTWLVGLLSGIIGGAIVFAGTLIFTPNKTIENNDSQLNYVNSNSDDVQVTKVGYGNSRALGETDFCERYFSQGND